ncbi:DUF4405 domain-containing protein [Thermococcus sp. Bubb.Bath]|uniref:DUF4405 domain-containing protein n=1 Tax=Thermococcus sp. Bubb.Bath TaxID=1638242 RepID=UPI001439D946|nr:DUF4405 domain-containing protein [Thermococcus sp. Bubb.Bath]NJF24164.1 DUF4405 domain-containing protein [Thermococcus sp. Bubb.Bath]
MRVPRWFKPTLDMLLLFDFIIEALSGIALYLAPSGRIAREELWTFMGLGKEAWEGLHIYFGFAMVALVALHLFVNFGPMLCMLRNIVTNRKERKVNWRNIAAIMALSVLFVGGGIIYALLGR